MAEPVSIHLCQYAISADWPTTRRILDEQFQYIQNPDIVVLPEAFNTGFSVAYDQLNWQEIGDSLNYIQEKSKQLDCLVVAGSFWREAGQLFNRLFAFVSGRLVYTYDKHHLFALSPEASELSAGTQSGSFLYKGIRIKPLICYDLRFPEWARAETDFDLLLYIANWPQSRQFHWTSLLTARAIENQCFVVGCNCVGEDAAGLCYNGGSAVYAYDGTTLCSSTEQTVLHTQLPFQSQQHYRTKFPFLQDREPFNFH